jgi:hypothetical protein
VKRFRALQKRTVFWRPEQIALAVWKHGFFKAFSDTVFWRVFWRNLVLAENTSASFPMPLSDYFTRQRSQLARGTKLAISHTELAISQTREAHALYGRHLFAYLPDAQWLKRVEYNETVVGSFYHEKDQQLTYRITVLSQSGRFLFFCNDQLRHSVVITSDEELLRALTTLDFPLPA